LDIYDEENQIYTPYDFHDFCGFECRFNELTERYDVNGFVNGTMTIASFENEELAVAVTRSLFTIKAVAEVHPQPEARFVDVDMIIDELEEEEEVIIEDLNETEIEEKIEEVAYCNVANKLLCVCIGLIIGFTITCLVI
jgi:hypothetical protein